VLCFAFDGMLEIAGSRYLCRALFEAACCKRVRVEMEGRMEDLMRFGGSIVFVSCPNSYSTAVLAVLKSQQ